MAVRAPADEALGVYAPPKAGLTMREPSCAGCLPVERFPSGLFEPKHHVDAVVAGNWLDVAWHLGGPAQHRLDFHRAH
jgi:hypothetical protein